MLGVASGHMDAAHLFFWRGWFLVQCWGKWSYFPNRLVYALLTSWPETVSTTMLWKSDNDALTLKLTDPNLQFSDKIWSLLRAFSRFGGVVSGHMDAMSRHMLMGNNCKARSLPRIGFSGLSRKASTLSFLDNPLSNIAASLLAARAANILAAHASSKLAAQF